MTLSSLANDIESLSLLENIPSSQSYVINDQLICWISISGNLHLFDNASKEKSTFSIPSYLTINFKIKMNRLNTLVAIWSPNEGLAIQPLDKTLNAIRVFNTGLNDYIVYVEWHPSSLYSDHLLILTKLGHLYLYRVGGGKSVLELDLSVRLTGAIQYNCIDGTFLESSGEWDWATLLILLENGDVIQICPIIPLPAKIDPSCGIEGAMKSDNGGLIVTKNPFELFPLPSKPFLVQPEPIEISADFTFIESFSFNGLTFVLIGWGNYRIDLFLLSSKPKPGFEDDGEDQVMNLLESIEFPKGPFGSKMQIKKIIDNGFIVTLQGLKQSYKLTFPWLSSFGDSLSVKSQITPLLKTPTDHVDTSIVFDRESNSRLYIFPSATSKPLMFNESDNVKFDRQSFHFDFGKSFTESELEKCGPLKVTEALSDYSVPIPVSFKADFLAKYKLPFDLTENSLEELLKVADEMRCNAFTKLTGAVQDLQTRLDYIESTKLQHHELLDDIESKLNVLQERQQGDFVKQIEDSKQRGKELRKRLFGVLEKFDQLHQSSGAVMSCELEAELIGRIDEIRTKLESSQARPSVYSYEPEISTSLTRSSKAIEKLSVAISLLKTR